MNYVVLNNEEFFNDIKINKLKKVDLHGTDRVDAVFAHITKKILEHTDREPEPGDSILPEAWLLRDRGVSFILAKVDRDILYDENTELIQTMFGLLDKEQFYIEIWNFNEQESYNQLQCYLLAYNKNFGYQEIFIPDDSQEKEDNIFMTLLKKIEKNLL